MATATLRPNATFYNSGWTVVGASAHGAVDDSPDDDATYVQAAAGTWLLVYDLGPLTLPAYAQIRAVTVQVRRSGNSSSTLDVAVGYQPVTGDYQKIVWSGEKPGAAIDTKTYGSLVSAPGGAAWNNSTIVPNLQVALGANSPNIRVYEVYVNVVYDEAPLCVVTAPVGTIRGTQIPAITFSYADAEGAALERVQGKVWTDIQHAAAGWGPDTGAAFWDSGTVLTSAQSITIGVPLPAGDYWVGVRASDAGSSGRFGPWAFARFTMGGSLPATPTVSVTTDPAARRNTVTVVQRDNYLSTGQASAAAAAGEGDGWYADSNTALDSISSTAPTATSLAETFTGTDGALTAANTDINWTVVKGAFTVAGNQLTSSNTETILPSVIRADTALPSVDHFAQVVVNTLSTVADRSVHLMLRMAGSGYAGIAVELNQLNNRYAVWEALTSTTGRAVSNFQKLPRALALPAVWRAEVSGPTVSVYIQMFGDSTPQLLGQWATSILTGTQVGLGLYNAGSTSLVDTFSAGDLEPVVQGSSGGDYLLEMTVAAARQGRIFTGGTAGGVGTPVTAGEQLTLTAAAWQKADAARSVRADVEYLTAGKVPLMNLVFEDEWTGTTGAPWDTGKWTSAHAGAATDTIQANAGRLTTGAVAYDASARMVATGMSAQADTEVVALCVPSSTSAEMRACVVVRGDGTWNGPNPSHPNAGYWAEVSPDFASVFLRVQDGSSTILATVSITIPAQGVWVRLRAQGTTIAIKAWSAALQEPAKWSWVGENAAAASGRVQLAAQNGADAVSRTWTFDHLTVDDLSLCDFGTNFTTLTNGELSEHTRNIVVPPGAAIARMIGIGFPTGASEVFVWDKMGLMPGFDRPWSRGGLMAPNLYSPNEASFEEAAAGVAGWTGGDDATVTRAAYAVPPSGAALDLAWDGSSGFPSLIYGYGPGKPAVEGLDYTVTGWLWRISSDVTSLKIGIKFTDASGGLLAESYSADYLPTPLAEWAFDATHTMRAPAGTAYVHAAYAASPVTSGAAAITNVGVVQGGSAPAVFQPGPAAVGFALVEYAVDGGAAWERVRGTSLAAFPASRTVVVHDNEAPAGAARLYRASTAAVDYGVDSAGGAVVASVPSGQVPATLPASGFWLRDPLVPSRLLEISIGGDLESTSREPQETHDTLGRPNPVVVSDVVKGEEFTLPLIFKTAAAWRQFEELRRTGAPLLLQGDWGEQWFVKLGPNRRVTLKSSTARATGPLRLVDITAVQVDRPDPGEQNFGVVTDLVWETV